MQYRPEDGSPVQPRWTPAEIALVYLFGQALAFACLMLLRGILGVPGALGADSIATARLGLWASVLTFVPTVVGAVLLLRNLSGTTCADLGLTFRRARWHALAGVIAAVVITPGVYAIQALAMLLCDLFAVPREEHLLSRLGQAGLSPLEWGLLIFAAVVVAPVWEELFYRSVVQSWVIANYPMGGLTALSVALSMTILTGPRHWLPSAILVLVSLGYPLLEKRKDLAGIFASSVLFAWVHSKVWPSPLPLLWLALGLGWLRYRTGGLVAPIVLHACFNAVACAVLVTDVLSKASGAEP